MPPFVVVAGVFGEEDSCKTKAETGRPARVSASAAFAAYPPLEAMASGVLCVATPMDFGQPGVDHIPILANSSDSIVRVMQRVFTLQDHAPFIEAGLRTAATFSWDRIADQWCTLLAKDDGAQGVGSFHATHAL